MRNSIEKFNQALIEVCSIYMARTINVISTISFQLDITSCVQPATFFHCNRRFNLEFGLKVGRIGVLLCYDDRGKSVSSFGLSFTRKESLFSAVSAH